MAYGAVDEHPLEGEVADHPQPPPSIGGGIVHTQGDGPADAGAAVPQPACALVCRIVALVVLHRCSFYTRRGVPFERRSVPCVVHDAMSSLRSSRCDASKTV